jgi:hypothetical protein
MRLLVKKKKIQQKNEKGRLKTEGKYSKYF